MRAVGRCLAYLCVLQKRHRITGSSVLVHGSSLWQHTQLRVVVLSPAFLPLSAPQHPWPKKNPGVPCVRIVWVCGVSSRSPFGTAVFFFFNPRGLWVPVCMRVRVQADVCTAPLTLQMIRPCLFFVCLCQACTAFVFFPATTRLPLRRVQRPCEPRAAAATARTPPAETRGWTTRSVGRRPQLLSSSIGGVGEGNVAVGGAGAAPEDDPFRPERASVSPMVINAIVSVLFKHVRRCAQHQPTVVCWFQPTVVCWFFVLTREVRTPCDPNVPCAHTSGRCACMVPPFACTYVMSWYSLCRFFYQVAVSYVDRFGVVEFIRQSCPSFACVPRGFNPRKRKQPKRLVRCWSNDEPAETGDSRKTRRAPSPVGCTAWPTV